MKRFFPTSDHTGTDPALRVERYLEAPRHTRDQGGMQRLYHDHQPRIREKREECVSGELKRGRICSPRSTSPRDRRRSHYPNRPNRHQFSWRTLTSPVLYSSNRAGPIPHPSRDIRKRVLLVETAVSTAAGLLSFCNFVVAHNTDLFQPPSRSRYGYRASLPKVKLSSGRRQSERIIHIERSSWRGLLRIISRPGRNSFGKKNSGAAGNQSLTAAGRAYGFPHTSSHHLIIGTPCPPRTTVQQSRHLRLSALSERPEASVLNIPPTRGGHAAVPARSPRAIITVR